MRLYKLAGVPNGVPQRAHQHRRLRDAPDDKARDGVGQVGEERASFVGMRWLVGCLLEPAGSGTRAACPGGMVGLHSAM